MDQYKKKHCHHKKSSTVMNSEQLYRLSPHHEDMKKIRNELDDDPHWVIQPQTGGLP